MNTSIEINGILLSASAQDTLKRWQKSGTLNSPSDPERYIEYLNDAQDCLTRIMLEESNMQVIAEVLTKLILIKDDLKLLIPKTNYQS